MNWGELREWALEDAQNRGRTCDTEPEITLQNCDVHGVHAAHLHGPECNLSRIAVAHLN